MSEAPELPPLPEAKFIGIDGQELWERTAIVAHGLTCQAKQEKEIGRLKEKYADWYPKEYTHGLERTCAELRAKLEALTGALSDAAKSLEAIQRNAGSDDFMLEAAQIRAYAGNQAIVAREAIDAARAEKGEKE